jgi:hypothetical protein
LKIVKNSIKCFDLSDNLDNLSLNNVTLARYENVYELFESLILRRGRKKVT